jgi:pimeloyl-ACP methyl ester carboxylesterase
VIRLESYTTFHAGGRAVEVTGKPTQTVRLTASVAQEHDPNGRFIIEQCYVQQWVPADRITDTYVLLAHGGGLTGVTWETTPDGRPGFLHHFLEAGFPVAVVDHVERGRSGFCGLDGFWPDQPIVRSEREAWHLFRFGRPGDFDARKPLPGQRFPLAAMDAFMAQFVPRWQSTSGAQIAALTEAIRRIGPCVPVAHSQGGWLGSSASVRVPELIRGFVSLEGSGFPPDEAVTAATVAGKPWLYVLGDFLDEHPTWKRLDGESARFIERINRLGAKGELVHLGAAGFPGATHMMMMDENSADIAAWLIGWIKARVLGL